MGFVFDVEAATEVTDLMLHEFAEEQLPFATAVSLTRLAQEAVDKTRGRMRRRFTLRSRRVPKGIQFNRANKKDWPKLHAEAGILDDFMVLQELGGTKRPRRGARFLAIPTRAIKRTASGKVRKTQQPRSITARKTGFIDDGMIQRRRTRSRRLGLMFFLREEATIEPRLGMRETSAEVMETRYAAVFDKELKAAIRSRRARKESFSSQFGRFRYIRARMDVEGGRMALH